MDGTFGWYQDKNVQDDNYYSGTYEAHRGQAGLDFLAESLTEFEHFITSAFILPHINKFCKPNFHTSCYKSRLAKPRKKEYN